MWTPGLVAGVRAGNSVQTYVRRRRPDAVRIQQTHDPAPVLRNLRYSVFRHGNAPQDRRKIGGHQCAMRGWRRRGRAQGEKGRRQELIIAARRTWVRLSHACFAHDRSGHAIGAKSVTAEPPSVKRKRSALRWTL